MISLPKDEKSPSSESTNEDSPNIGQIKGKDFGQHSAGMMFIKEHTGSIKDFYKISSSIGRGKFCSIIILIKTNF